MTSAPDEMVVEVNETDSAPEKLKDETEIVTELKEDVPSVDKFVRAGKVVFLSRMSGNNVTNLLNTDIFLNNIARDSVSNINNSRLISFVSLVCFSFDNCQLTF